MPGQPENTEKFHWLIEPPAADRLHVYIAVGEGQDLSPAANEALENFMKALQISDDKGFETNIVNCRPRDWCNPEVERPCRRLVYCGIDCPPH
jgi:hypothetical protein